MMMRMLEAGDIAALTDGLRTADEDNPRGYWEFERAKNLAQDKDWLGDAEGKSVKLISALLEFLPEDREYKVVFMRRRISEVLASQKEMLIRRGRPTDSVGDDRMAALFEKHLAKIEQDLQGRASTDVLYLTYHEVVADPATAAASINALLGGTLDEQRMVEAVEPSLHRQRK